MLQLKTSNVTQTLQEAAATAHTATKTKKFFINTPTHSQ